MPATSPLGVNARRVVAGREGEVGSWVSDGALVMEGAKVREASRLSSVAWTEESAFS